MRSALVAGVLGFGLLGGCSGVNYAMENYGQAETQKYYYKNQSFRIFDVPSKNRLMISPSIGAAMWEGFTLGLADKPEMLYEKAAQAFLVSTGRSCIVGDLKLVIDPQWETFYTCE